MAPAIEEALSDELDHRAWHDIIAMGDVMKHVIVASALVKVSDLVILIQKDVF